MKRRDFIKYGVGGLAAVALGSVGMPPLFTPRKAHAATLTLDMIEVEHEMVDGQLVYSWAFRGPTGPSIPGPVIFAREGELIDLTINNFLDEAHGFAIEGNLPGTFVVKSPVIGAGTRNARVRFNAPAPGTYLYEDWVNAPVGRVLGLHGVLVVLPADPASKYPYNNAQIPAGHPVRRLFDDFGVAAHFPGHPWDATKPEQNKIWVFSEIDPRFNELARNNTPFSAVDFINNFQSTYFTVNGMSGYFPANDHDVSLVGHLGRPILIRNVNVGMNMHSPHTHANHSYVIAVDGIPGAVHGVAGGNPPNVWWVDTWTMLPGDRKDLVFPMIWPPDIHPYVQARMNRGAYGPGNPDGTQTMMAFFDPVEPLNMAHPPGAIGQWTTLAYPMHSHQELSQTANGGNYPMGLIIHIEMTGNDTGV